MLVLRDYQQEAVDRIRESYLNGRRAPMLVLPTGGGKTVVFSYIATNSALKGKRALILVHRIELLRQTSASLVDNEVHHGMINAKFTPDPFAPVQVASVQTLVKKIDKYLAQLEADPTTLLPALLRDYDLIVPDECHHSNASTYRKIFNFFSRSYLLGVTATPIRGDGTSLGVESGGYYDDIIIGPQPDELMEMGFLVRAKVYAPKVRIDLSDVDMVAGDYNKSQVAKKVDKPTITGDAVEHYRRLCPGVPCIVFCVSVEHSIHVADQFFAAGYRATYADGSLNDEDRTHRLGGLKTGEFQIVCTCDLVSEGTDIPAVTCGILLRPTASLGLFMQQVGRVLRPVWADGFDRSTQAGRLASIAMSEKPFAYILDHVGNVLTHGMPSDDRDWVLDGEKRPTKKSVGEKPIRVQQCPQCYAVHEPADVCPECHYVYLPSERREIEQTAGDLQEVTADVKALIQRQLKTEVSQARTYPDLLAVEKKRGYKSGWARHVWKSRGKKELNM